MKKPPVDKPKSNMFSKPNNKADTTKTLASPGNPAKSSVGTTQSLAPQNKPLMKKSDSKPQSGNGNQPQIAKSTPQKPSVPFPYLVI